MYSGLYCSNLRYKSLKGSGIDGHCDLVHQILEGPVQNPPKLLRDGSTCLGAGIVHLNQDILDTAQYMAKIAYLHPSFLPIERVF